MKHRLFSGKRVAIVFALGLAGALAACSGDDDDGTTGVGGSSGSLDGGRGGSTDAAADRDSAADRTGDSSSVDGSDARGGGGADSSPDAVPDVVVTPDVRADVVADQSIDVPSDRGPDVSVDVIVPGSDASDAAVVPDVRDAGVVPDVVDAGSDRVDAAPDVAPDVTPDVVTTSDASDAAEAAVTIDAADASDAATLSFTPAQFESFTGPGVDGGDTSSSVDGGTITLTANYPGFGQSATLQANFATPQNWAGFSTLVVRVRALSGAATEQQVELVVQGGADSGPNGFGNVTDVSGLIDEGDFQDITLNVNGQDSVLSDVESVRIRITPKSADAGVPLTPTVIEIQSIRITTQQ